PDIVVHFLRNRLRPVHLTDGVAPFVTEPARNENLSQIAFLHPRHSFFDRETGTALSAGLNYFVVLTGGFHHLAAFPNIVTDGLFDVHVFARLNGPNRG